MRATAFPFSPPYPTSDIQKLPYDLTGTLEWGWWGSIGSPFLNYNTQPHQHLLLTISVYSIYELLSSRHASENGFPSPSMYNGKFVSDAEAPVPYAFRLGLISIYLQPRVIPAIPQKLEFLFMKFGFQSWQNSDKILIAIYPGKGNTQTSFS